jgi:hypothetical protein
MATSFDILSISGNIRRHRRLIIASTLIMITIGTVVYSIAPYKYRARTEFIVRNPMYGDRTAIYNNDSRLSDYFASEDDLNKIIMLSGTDIVQQTVIKNMHLAAAYKIDTTTSEGKESLERKFDNSLKVMRTEYTDMVLTYTDTDPKRAVAVADECVHILDSTYSDYYREMRRGMYESILYKLHDQDSAINALTDTLIAMRNRYDMYGSKYNVLLGGKQGDGKKIGQGVEQIENIESIKNELIANRESENTLINHYKTGLKDHELPVIKVVTPAKVQNRAGIGEMLLEIGLCGIIGFFFTTLAVLFYDYNIANKHSI